MSAEAPSTLWDLAVQSLLRSEALDISDLEYLPEKFFPLLLKEAFTGSHSKSVRVMVAAWPFSCLCLGDLIKTPLNMETFLAVLDGLDLLITQKGRPRRWKLEVLDLRNVWPGAGREDCYSPRFLNKTQTVESHAECGGKQTLKVVFDYRLQWQRHMTEQQECFIQWAQYRKSFLHLCCQKLQIAWASDYNFPKLLRLFEPECIQEVEVNTCLELKTLATFAPVLGQMRNLHKLFLKGTCKSWRDEFEDEYRDLEETWINAFISQFPKLQTLQHLCMHNVYFLEGHLDQVLRYLKKPLETLSLTWCKLSESDWHYLSECPHISQLKHLKLSGVLLFYGHSRPLKDLLERLTTTLQTLELENCLLRPPDLSGLLPVLSLCSQLTMVNFYETNLSVHDLKNLLLHTTSLSQLTLELYSLPRECYEEGDVLIERSSRVCTELMDTLRAVRRPKTVRFASYICYRCKSESFLYDLGISLSSTRFLTLRLFPDEDPGPTNTSWSLQGQSLLKDEVLDISALQNLPIELFPFLFKRAH
ncbi:PRAME family member 12-like [Nannospalax galili]|uniref:PRAME family member 12-like n=1 Tax=Nannospalax galili TaxID=1026970 RepID=UPI0004ED27B6|nr:PRAME family member 12-like [Nannospalax galili]